MAKIGNEAKLILKLAEQQMAERARQIIRVTKEGDDQYIKGYERAVSQYDMTLNNIILELEAKG